MQLTKKFLDVSCYKLLDEYWPRMRACVESLSNEQVWWRPNESSNSIGNLLLHLNGNVRQWVITSFKGTEDQRNRPAEFAQRDAIPTEQLLNNLEATLREAVDVISNLTDEQLMQTMSIQGYESTGLYAVYHVVEHFALHYGQVTYITKLLKGQDLGFYRELDATGRAR